MLTACFFFIQVSPMNESTDLPSDLTNGEPGLEQPGADPSENASAVTTTAAEPPASAPVEPSATAPSEPSATATSEPNATAPAEPRATAPSEPTATAPSEPTATAPSEPTATAPSEPTATAPSEPSATAPSEPSATAPSESTATAPAEAPNWREESLGERNHNGCKTTFHVYKNDQQVGYYLERIYNLDSKMVRMVKRSGDGRSETRFDPDTGDIERIFEAYNLPDGNHLSKEKRYLDQDHTTESVLVVFPGGGLVRAVVREAIGLINTFQGQTEFGPDGYATVSINHWFDRKTTKMTMREQIQWLPGGERGVTEHFYFAEDGGLTQYHKVLYHPGSNRFLEELHTYEVRSQKLRRKEVKSYERHSDVADMEVTTFDADGAVIERAKNVSLARSVGSQRLNASQLSAATWRKTLPIVAVYFLSAILTAAKRAFSPSGIVG